MTASRNFPEWWGRPLEPYSTFPQAPRESPLLTCKSLLLSSTNGAMWGRVHRGPLLVCNTIRTVVVYIYSCGDGRIRTYGGVTLGALAKHCTRPLCDASMAEVTGFEPAKVLPLLRFQHSAIVRSATLPLFIFTDTWLIEMPATYTSISK